VKKTIILAYVISSISAVVCGLLVVGQIWSGDALIGEVYTMDSVTSVLVGGTTFTGGEGGLLGTFAGAFIISMLSNILNMLNVFSYFQYIIKGLILIVSIFISFRFFSRRRKVYE
jgi:ribose/xylose/arabinose/galactoside ABC-type transport system permease subunit